MNNMRKLDKGKVEYKCTRIEAVRMEKKLNTPRRYIAFTNACSQRQKLVLHLEMHAHEGNDKDLGFLMSELVKKIAMFFYTDLCSL